MGNSNTTAFRLKAVRLFNACEFQTHLLPPYHCEKIVREHLAMKTAIGRRNFKKKDWVVYYTHMDGFISSLPPPKTDIEICEAIEFYRRMDRRLELPVEFAQEDRATIFDRHNSLKELKQLSTAVVRKNYESLIEHENTMRTMFARSNPPLYTNDK